MKPYLEHVPFIVALIDWGGFLLVMALVLSPFLIIRFQRFRPIRWWHVIGAYLSSFTVLILVWILIGKIDRWLNSNFINSGWYQDPLIDLSLRASLLLVLIYPGLVFYSTKLLQGKFTKKGFIISFLIASLLFVLLGALLVFTALHFLVQAGLEHL